MNSGQQRDLFPLRVIATFPSDLGSADCKNICIAEDGMTYAAKLITDGNKYIPASEWFCYGLAGKVGIATPPYKVLIMEDGNHAFGSAWEGGVVKNDPITLQKIFTNEILIQELSKVLSSIFVFDLFVNNDDRHVGNYIFRQSLNSYVLLAFDYSRAWLCRGFPDETTFPAANSNTLNIYRQISTMQPFDLSVAEEKLGRISKIRSEVIREILESMPNEWIDLNMKTNLVHWWDSRSKSTRIDNILEGIRNGRFI